jgi:hypothetical protein
VGSTTFITNATNFITAECIIIEALASRIAIGTGAAGQHPGRRSCAVPIRHTVDLMIEQPSQARPLTRGGKTCWFRPYRTASQCQSGQVARWTETAPRDMLVQAGARIVRYARLS